MKNVPKLIMALLLTAILSACSNVNSSMAGTYNLIEITIEGTKYTESEIIESGKELVLEVYDDGSAMLIEDGGVLATMKWDKNKLYLIDKEEENFPYKKLNNQISFTIKQISYVFQKVSAEETESKNNQDSVDKAFINPTQEFIIEKIKKLDNIANIACATKENDPNNGLGVDGKYTAQIYFSTPLLGTEKLGGDELVKEGTSAGGSIEIYRTLEDAKVRSDYLASFDRTKIDPGEHVVLGSMIVRTSSEMSEKMASEFMDEILNALYAEE